MILTQNFTITLTPTEMLPPPNILSFNRPPVAPHNWNLYVSGFNPKESVNFLSERADLLRAARGISKEQLFHSACDLFEYPALTWFINTRNIFNR